MGRLSLQSSNPAKISNICTIWAQQEVAARIAEGVRIPDLIAGVHMSLAERVVRMARHLKIEKEVILNGRGRKKRRATPSALRTTCLRDPCSLGAPLITGALGAALLGKEIHEKHSSPSRNWRHDPGHSWKSRSGKGNPSILLGIRGVRYPLTLPLPRS